MTADAAQRETSALKSFGSFTTEIVVKRIVFVRLVFDSDLVR
jgi:hypothetical protein